MSHPAPELLAHLVDVHLDGVPANPVHASSIRHIALDEALNGPARLRMTVHDPSGDWQRVVLGAVDSDNVEAGRSPRLDLFPFGWGGSDGGASLFSGTLTRVEAEMGADRALTLDLVAHDPLRRLARTCRHRSHPPSTDVELARRLAQEHGLELRAEGPGVATSYLVQDGGTDLALLRQVCRRTGRDFLVRGGVLHLLSFQASRGTPILLEWGNGLERVSVEVERMETPDRVILRDRDVLAASTLEVGATASNSGNDGTFADSGSSTGSGISTASFTGIVEEDVAPGSAEVLENEAAARLEAARRRRERFEGLARGSPHLRAGALVQVTGAGEGMDGRWRLSRVEHRLGADGGWTVRLVGFRG